MPHALYENYISSLFLINKGQYEFSVSFGGIKLRNLILPKHKRFLVYPEKNGKALSGLSNNLEQAVIATLRTIIKHNVTPAAGVWEIMDGLHGA
jgi:hypothetical protein